MKRILFVLVCAVLVGGCAPQLTLDGQKASIGRAGDITSCRHVGNTKITLDAGSVKVLSEERVSEYLQIEARNFAGRIGADTVFPVGEIDECSRLFKLYMCGTDN